MERHILILIKGALRRTDGSFFMGKRFWTGFAAGAVCMFLVGTVGVNGVNFAIQQLTQSTGETININEAGKQNGTGDASNNASGTSVINVLSKVNLLHQYVDAYYLKEIDEQDMNNGIYKGYLAALKDPYSVYYTKEEYNSLQESTSGVYCGIGARVTQDMNTGIISIVTPFEGSPAAEAGIVPDDIIYAIEGEPVTGEDLSEVVAKMKGKEGTTVTLTLVRDGEEMEVEVERRKIEIPTVEYEMLENDIGYIKVSEFDEVTANQFRAAIADLDRQGQKGMIVDLRNNGGGRLTSVVDMLNRMLPEGTLVYTKDKNGKGETFSSTDKESFDKPFNVLINGNSASASEVFAGAVQDYKAGKLVGTTSFGKGIVQTIFNLKDGTAIKLTTSEYFTPEGRNIHETGLTPDIEVELEEGLKKKVIIDKDEDNQLQRAVEDLKERL